MLQDIASDINTDTDTDAIQDPEPPGSFALAVK